MLQQRMSTNLFEALAYFATGHIAYNDELPYGLPSRDLLELLLEREYIKKVPISPNDMIAHHDSPDRSFYYAISDEGKEAFYLEKEIRQKIAEQEADQEEHRRANDMQAVQDKKQQLRYDLSVAAFGELISMGLSHLAPNAINLVKTLLKALFRH